MTVSFLAGGAGGLHRSRDHLMLVVLGDGDHGDRHVRDACAGDGDGQAIRCDDSQQRQHRDPRVERPSIQTAT